MSWAYLFVAGLFEVSWIIGLKYCDSLRMSAAMLVVIISTVFSTVFLALAVKTIPTSLAYVIWTGMGIIGVLIYDLYVIKEPIPLVSFLFVGLIVVGILGLKCGMKVG